jgi:cysteinyl-tRNA synthetase
LDSGFVQVQVAGENKGTHMGAKMVRSSEANRLAYKTHTISGNTLTVVQESPNVCCETVFESYDSKFKSYLENDLNTSNAITLLYDLLKDDSVNNTTKIELIKSWDEVFSLDLLKKEENDKELEEYILSKIEERKIAKQNKDYALADAIRNELLEKKIELKDTREGTIWNLL